MVAPPMRHLLGWQVFGNFYVSEPCKPLTPIDPRFWWPLVRRPASDFVTRRRPFVYCLLTNYLLLIYE
jgi:hypothetical protein